jgi:hypothetical protein
MFIIAKPFNSEYEFWSQIWGYSESIHQTICYDPSIPLHCPPAQIQEEVRYAIH